MITFSKAFKVSLSILSNPFKLVANVRKHFYLYLSLIEKIIAKKSPSSSSELLIYRTLLRFLRKFYDLIPGALF